MPLPYNPRARVPGLNAVLARYGLPTNPLKQEYKRRFNAGESGEDVFGKTRPLSDRDVAYAAGDVEHLLALHKVLEASALAV